MESYGGGWARTYPLDWLNGVVLWAVGVTLAGVEAVLFLSPPVQPWQAMLFPATALSYLSAGTLAWSRRPNNRMGPLLYLGGIFVVIGGLQNTSSRGFVAVGLIFGVLPIAIVLHGLLAFPSGRLTRGLPSILAALGYLVTVPLQAPDYLLAQAGPLDPLVIGHAPGLVRATTMIARYGGLTVLLAGAGLLAMRLMAATPHQRRVLGPLYGYGVLTLLVLELATNVLEPLFHLGPIAVFTVQIGALAGVPVMFVTAMLRGGFARSGTLDELERWLSDSGAGRSHLRETLAEILGDPDLELLYRLEEAGTYVHGDGEPAHHTDLGSARSSVAIEHGGQSIGLIIYDAALIADPEWVRAAGRVVASAFERDRLTAALMASRESLRESRGRIVTAEDGARRRIARELHDRLQGRLVAVAIEAGRMINGLAPGPTREELFRVRNDVERTIDELRAIVQNIAPALLIERGLYAATQELLDALPLPSHLSVLGDDRQLSETTASTGFAVVSETLTNAMKHAAASRVEVSLSCDPGHLRIEIADDGVGGAIENHGSGLRGMTDRLDALNGRLRFQSPPGEGTTIWAEVPCAS